MRCSLSQAALVLERFYYVRAILFAFFNSSRDQSDRNNTCVNAKLSLLIELNTDYRKLSHLSLTKTLHKHAFP